MKTSTTVKRPVLYLSALIGVILVLIPFHAFLTVWLTSFIGHYTILRLWKEVLLACALTLSCYIIYADSKLRTQLYSSKLMRLIGIYTLVLLIWGAIALATHSVSAKALAYGLLVDLRFLAFFTVAWIAASRSGMLLKNWQPILLVPAAIVVVFGLLQRLVLPYDFLKHFGYGSATIFPYETINHNIHFIRIMSTLRGANPLGAYLIVPLSALTVLLLKAKSGRLSKALLGAGIILTLFYSYSRSAWIGAFLSVLLIFWVSLKTDHLRRYLNYGLPILILISAIVALGLRHNTAFEDAVLHTDHNSQAIKSSNQGHIAAFRDGARDIIHQPLGRGPGTAGPASVYNNHPPRIAENYFLQIGQEAGLIGMALFIAINLLVAKLLWLKRNEPLALALFAGLIGLTLVNLLSHAWTDDTIAYIFWGLCGIALAPKLKTAS